jgi:hypothetical protein
MSRPGATDGRGTDQGTDRGDTGGDARRVAGIIGALAVLGALAGVAWSQLVTTPMVTRDRAGLLTEGVELGRRVEADVWFALLGVAVALPVGVVVGLLVGSRRRPDPVVAVLSLVAGALVASVLCNLVGIFLGPPDPATVLEGAESGDQAPEMLTTHTWVVYLVWPLAASTGALVALLLRPPRLQEVSRSDNVSDKSPS